MKTGTKVALISMGAVLIAMFLFIIYQITAFYHYKSVVLDRFPVEPPSKEEKRFFELEKERKDQGRCENHRMGCGSSHSCWPALRFRKNGCPIVRGFQGIDGKDKERINQ